MCLFPIRNHPRPMCGMILSYQQFLSPLCNVLCRLKTGSSEFGGWWLQPSRSGRRSMTQIHTQNACPLPRVTSKDTHKGNEDSFLAGCDAVSLCVSRRFEGAWYRRFQGLRRQEEWTPCIVIQLWNGRRASWYNYGMDAVHRDTTMEWTPCIVIQLRK